MRSSSVLFAAFVMAAVAPVMSAPAPALKDKRFNTSILDLGLGSSVLVPGGLLAQQAEGKVENISGSLGGNSTILKRDVPPSSSTSTSYPAPSTIFQFFKDSFDIAATVADIASTGKKKEA